jgi:hypothetical protein
MASGDPDFETKAANIIGLYLDPPQHAAVFCVDEKSAIQALDRLDPVLPLSPDRVERHGFVIALRTNAKEPRIFRPEALGFLTCADVPRVSLAALARAD